MTEVPRDIMQGYALLALEAEGQGATADPCLHAGRRRRPRGRCRLSTPGRRWGAARPNIIVVEPDNADCLLDSAVAGRVVTVGGALDTIIAGLACGEPSLLAWEICRARRRCLSSPSPTTTRGSAMRDLADGSALSAGESGVAGLAALPAPWRATLSFAGPGPRRLAARVLCYRHGGRHRPCALCRTIVGHCRRRREVRA
jgi:diaminopropionate ammonia-lyase